MSGGPSIWRFYDGHFRGAYPSLLLSVPLTIGQALSIIPITAVVSRAFDTIIPAGDVRGLLLAGGLILLLYLANLAFTLLSRMLVLRATKQAISGLRNDLIRRSYERSWAWFQDDTGRLHSSIVHDTEHVDVLTYALVAIFLPETVIALCLIVVLLLIDPYLLGLLTLVVPVIVVLSRRLAWRARGGSVTYRQSTELFSTSVLNALRQMELTRTQGSEQIEIKRQAERVEELRQVSGHMAWLWAAHAGMQRTALASAGVMVLIVGGQSVAAGSLTLGALLSFSVATALLVTHLSAAVSSLPQIFVGIEALRHLAAFWSPGDVAPYSGQQVRSFGGTIQVESVWFQYGDTPLLRGVDLTLEPGTTVALVGENGAGKSTLLQLILGLYRPDQGRLLADGIAYSDLDLVKLRRSIGVVPQDPLIVPGTVLENITYGTPDVDQETVERAVEAVMAQRIVERLPNGYATVVGEGGVSLSGGQRQRLAIARALVRDPALLVLDEPGNHLDRATVRQILANLRGGARQPTMLIITHDEETVETCDAVYLLEDGRITARRQLAMTGVPDDAGAAWSR